MKINKKNFFGNFETLKFIYKATKKLSPENITYLQIKKLKDEFYFIGATNGYRIHFAFLWIWKDIEEGFYKAVIRKDEIELEKIEFMLKEKDIYEILLNKYEVITNDHKINLVKYRYIDFFVKNDYSFSGFCLKLYKILNEDFLFNISWWNDMMQFSKKKKIELYLNLEKIEAGITLYPILFEINQNVYALVMPAYNRKY